MDTDALLASAVFVGVVTTALLVADAISAFVDARRVRDEDDLDALGHRRARDVGWSIAVTAALAVITAYAADAAARLVWNEGHPVVGALILLGVTLLAFAVGLAAVLAVVRRERPSYARIRRDLRDRTIQTLEPEELTEFEERLEQADRVRERRSRTVLPLRVIGLVLVVALAVLAWLVFSPVVGAVFTIVAVVGLTAFLVAVRSDVVRRAALESVFDAQRAEVLALLERARIPSRRHVPGLRDRVSRALAILREQQR